MVNEAEFVVRNGTAANFKNYTRITSTDSTIEGKVFKIQHRGYLCVNNPKQRSIECYENLPVNVIL